MRTKKLLTLCLIASILATAVLGGIYSRYIQVRGNLTPLTIVKENYITMWYVHYEQRIGVVFIAVLLITVILAITTGYVRRHNAPPL